MPRQMDFSRSYAEVYGLPGAVFEQDGIRFRRDGTEAMDIEPVVEEDNRKTPDDILPACTLTETQTPPAGDVSNKPAAEMHWRQLKTLVEAYGGIWTNKEDALAFLKGKK